MAKEISMGTCYHEGKLCEKIMIKTKDQKRKIIHRPVRGEK